MQKGIIDLIKADKKIFLIPLIVEIIYFGILASLNLVGGVEGDASIALGIAMIVGYFIGLILMMILSFISINRLIKKWNFNFITAGMVATAEAFLVALIFGIIYLTTGMIALTNALSNPTTAYYYSQYGSAASAASLTFFGYFIILLVVIGIIIVLRGIYCFLLGLFLENTKKKVSFKSNFYRFLDNTPEKQIERGAQKQAIVLLGGIFTLTILVTIIVGLISVASLGNVDPEYWENYNNPDYGKLIQATGTQYFEAGDARVDVYSDDLELAEINFTITSESNKTIEINRDSLVVNSRNSSCGVYLFQYTDIYSTETSFDLVNTAENGFTLKPRQKARIKLVAFGENCGYKEDQNADYKITFNFGSNNNFSTMETININGKYSGVYSAEDYLYNKSKAQALLIQNKYNESYSHFIDSYYSTLDNEFYYVVNILFDKDENFERVKDFYKNHYLKDFPDSKIAHNALCYYSPSTQEGVNYCLKAYEFDSKDLSNTNNLSLRYYETSDYDNSLKYALKSYELNAENNHALYHLVRSYLKKNNCDLAKKYFDEYVLLPDKDPISIYTTASDNYYSQCVNTN
ncbi:MAG: DUF4013 domain-containing protein [Candidatus Diapherotrites archaeon]|jgi:hypothetical protein|uniref:DUF4013 domain-containing protein n=1 Tax=Candidatus Iainarchaeum sp. TaxID=3101447 RepID=A0A8T5GGN8_9ARCH|nr:DUF4013 domain-containing protein [Candidatus Diapherotrites archaeon]MBT7241741.1 DUF4013 domain-containing protein [Candidatus Diapherotrites archaeon]